MPVQTSETCTESAGPVFLAEIKCPVCLQYMLPPITMCQNGHNICHKCKPRLNSCPDCKSELVDVRNHAIETVSEKVVYPCKYKEYGCVCTVPIGSKHEEEECPHGPFKCPYNLLLRSCDWVGPLMCMKKHLNESHSRCTGSNDPFKDLMYHSYKIYVSDEIFFGLVLWDPKKKYVSCSTIMYVGPKKAADNYEFTIWLRKAKEDGAVCFSGRVKSYIDGYQKNLEPENCGVFYRDVALQCLGKDKRLLTNIKITKI